MTLSTGDDLTALCEGGKTKVGDSIRLIRENRAIRVTAIQVNLPGGQLGVQASDPVRGGSRIVPYRTYGSDWDRPEKPAFIPFSALGGPGQGGRIRIDKEHLNTGTDANISESVASQIGYNPQGNWEHAGHLVARSLGGPGGYTSGNIVPMTASMNLSGMPGIERPARDDIRDNDAVLDYKVRPFYNSSQQVSPVKIEVEVERLYPDTTHPSNLPRKKEVNNT